MEVGFIYSSKDPKQLKTRNHIINFIKERGILARFIEKDQPVKSPKLIIDGHALYDQRESERKGQKRNFPDLKDLTKFIEHRIWSL